MLGPRFEFRRSYHLTLFLTPVSALPCRLTPLPSKSEFLSSAQCMYHWHICPKRRFRCKHSAVAGSLSLYASSSYSQKHGNAGGVVKDNGVGGRSLSVLRILDLVQPGRTNLGVGTGACLISTVILLVKPAVLGFVVDSIANGISPRHLISEQICLLTLYVFGAISKFVEVACLRVAGEKVVFSLRIRVMASYLDSSVGTSEESSAGSKLSRLQSDSADLQNAVTKHVPELFTGAIEAVFGCIVLLRICPHVLPVISISIPLCVYGAHYYGRAAASLAKSYASALADAADVAMEQVQNVHVVKAFAQERSAVERYKCSLERVFGFGKDLAIAQGLMQSLSRMLWSVKVVPVLWIGATRMSSGALSVGGMFALAMYMSMVVRSMGKAVSGWGEFSRASGAVSRIFELVAGAPSDLLQSGQKESTSSSSICGPPIVSEGIEFHNVFFRYPNRPNPQALRGLSCYIQAGSSVCICGKSGSGKSTFAALLQRFFDPSGGEIRIDGRPIQLYDLSALRSTMGFVPQEPVLFSGTIRENIAFGKCGATETEVESAAEHAGVMEFAALRPMGLDSPATTHGLSGGEKQRIVIARALVRKPRVLVLDEVTANLDVLSEKLVNETIARLIGLGKTTVVVISHRLSIAKHCEKVFVFEHGRLARQGPYATLSSLILPR